MKQEIKNLDELEVYAKKFLSELVKQDSRAAIIGLSGELGSGKTAFVKAVARELGVKEDVSSPTFVIAKFYQLSDGYFSRLIHIDAYRIKHPEELKALRFKELITDPKHLIMFEWPELAGELFPPTAQMLEFQFINETTRAITVIK